MVAFLIRRPVAVSMTFLALLVLGVVAATFLPVSLVPDVDIPRISVQVNAPSYSARELESRVMERLRMYLMQVNGLRDLKTESRDGNGMISLEFEFGTPIDLAYIEVNEQVDKATITLPRDLPRPAVVKASASDIPVFYLDIYPQKTSSRASGHDEAFLQLSAFADEIIRRRLEQIPQVAMADMSGRAFPEIIIRPDMQRLHALDLAPEAIETAIRSANVTLGNIMIRDKQYQYNVRVGTPLLQAEDIGNLWLSHKGQLWQLRDLCHIETRARDPEGMVFSGNNRAVTLAVIKQADARMQDLKKELHAMVEHFKTDYPHMEFTVYRDQTVLLDYTLANLGQTLIIGAILAFVVMFLFLRDARAPWLIVISVPAAIVVSLLFFFLLGISINIISISGLILCVGMMIDNSIIVIDNITRYRREGLTLFDACTRGTTEVFSPLLSSVLTTCSVFIPLIFLGGLAGALFYDQAMAVAIGLLVSLLIAMTLTPVYYFLLYKNTTPKTQAAKSLLNYQLLYEKGFRFTMRRQGVVWALFILLLAGMPLLVRFIDKEQLPAVEHQSMLLRVDWNENIHVGENQRRMEQLMDLLGKDVSYYTINTGRQQFIMDRHHNSNRRQSLVYLMCHSPSHLTQAEEKAREFFMQTYPGAIYRFEEDGNLFDQVFALRQAPLEVRLRPLKNQGRDQIPGLQSALALMHENIPGFMPEPLPLQEVISLTPNLQMMALHKADMASVQRNLSRIFNESHIITLMDNRISIPVKLGSGQEDVLQMLGQHQLRNHEGVDIPLELLLSQSRNHQLQTITAGLEGEYFPVEMHTTASQLDDLTAGIRDLFRAEQTFDTTFSGSIFSQRALMKELLLIGLVALLLLFFILAAQFESLRQPFIVLLEVPLAMTGALLLLMIFGATLNVMSMIGLVVMSGIIINDSILKIDTINRLRAGGMPLIRALYTAGHYRLKPILMTSITTIFALLPFLFISGLGGELQKPLALAVMGGLGLGTLVSLFFVPLCYYYIFKTKS